MKLFILPLLVICLSTFGQKNSNKYSITGDFTKVKTGKLYLYIYRDAGTEKDSANVVNGYFSFRGNIEKPTITYLTFAGSEANNANYFQFYLEAEAMKISGEGDSLKNILLTGSGLNDDFKTLNKSMSDITAWEERDNIIYTEAAKAKDKHILDSLDLVDWEILDAKRKVVTQFVKEHPSSMASAFAISGNFGYYAEASDVAPLYNSLDAKIKNSETGMSIKKMMDAYKRTSVGELMPDIIQTDTLGKRVSLSSLRGHYVLVDFWASWCGPCRRENPNIVKAFSKYHSKGFEIFGVSYDNEKGAPKWRKAIVDDHLNWYQVSDLKGWQNATSDQFYIKAIPANILLDKEGRIIGKNLFGKQLTEKLASLMM